MAHPDRHPNLKLFLPALALLTTSCTGVATTIESVIGCVKSERQPPPTMIGGTILSKHELVVKTTTRTYVLLSEGDHAKKIDKEYNAGDEVKLSILLSESFYRGDSTARAVAEKNLAHRMSTVLNARVIALDETGKSTQLNKLGTKTCDPSKP